MCALARKAQRTVFIAGKAHTAAHQILYDRVGRADHQIHGGRVVFIVARTHGIIKKRAIVGLTVLHTNAALRQKRVGFIGFLLGEQKNAISLGQIERAVQARRAGAHNNNIKIFVKFHIVTPSSWGNPAAFFGRCPRIALPVYHRSCHVSRLL